MIPKHLLDLPYVLHTNRELGLMLRGVKPLAYFYEAVGYKSDVMLRYQRWFDRRVATGRLVKREIVEALPQLPDRLLRHVLYSLPGEAWRIDAMLALMRLPGRWTRDRERRFGELLGYEPWQMDYWMNHLPQNWKI